MTEPNEQQIELMQKYKMNPANWVVFQETSKKLIVLSKRTKMRKVLVKESSYGNSRSSNEVIR